MFSHLFECDWMLLDGFGHVRIHPDTLGCVGMQVAFVPNTGEVSDEMRASTTPEISEAKNNQRPPNYQ